jgi:signal transduction histidine kinase
MGEMVHNIAHQWRQPLNTVGLILQNIALDYEENLLTSASLHEYAENGKALVQEMSVTIDDFRNFFTPQREKMVFSLRQAIDSALNIVHASFLNHGIAIDFDGGADARAVGYPNECSQVLLNLLSNAKEAILERNIRGGKIAILLGQDEQNAWVAVKDNGGGIAKDILPKIFDPYFTTKKKGTGIGLYMSKMIMNHMGGGITIRNVEGGAEVLLKLPLSVN